MFKFYSQQMITKTYGARQVRQSALTQIFAAKPLAAEQGWFCVVVKTTREQALKLMSRAAATITDLIVEDEQGNALSLPGVVLA